MTSSQPLVDGRSAAFSRLAARVIEVLNEAVEQRKLEGDTLAAMADRIGCHRSSLSRVLNGTTRNVTIKTVSDILWAAEFEPRDFRADPCEELCSNWIRDMDTILLDGEFRLVLPLQTAVEVTKPTRVPKTNLQNFEIQEVAL